MAPSIISNDINLDVFGDLDSTEPVEEEDESNNDDPLSKKKAPENNKSIQENSSHDLMVTNDLIDSLIPNSQEEIFIQNEFI